MSHQKAMENKDDHQPPQLFHQHQHPTKLRDLMQEWLLNWLDNQPTSFHNLHPTYHHTLAQQAAISWDQMFYGRFITTWSRLQEDHLHQHDSSSGTINGTKWLIGIIKIIWTQVHDNWETQNDACHGTDTCTCESAKYELTKQEMMALYKQCHKVVPRD